MLAGCGGDGDTDTAASATTAPPRLDAPATGLTWTSFNGMSIPQAEEGPRVKDAVAPHGYEQSPPGAALAAINATIRISVATDSQWPSVVRTEVAPGPTRDAFIANRIQLSTTTSVPAGQAPKVVGWKVTGYELPQATVDIYTEMPDKSMAVNHTTVAWTAASDWGLVLPDTSEGGTVAVEAISAIPAGAVHVKGP